MGCCLSCHLFLLIWVKFLSQYNASLPSFFSLQTAKSDTSGGFKGLSLGKSKAFFLCQVLSWWLTWLFCGEPFACPQGNLGPGPGWRGEARALLLRLLCSWWAYGPPPQVSLDGAVCELHTFWWDVLLGGPHWEWLRRNCSDMTWGSWFSLPLFYVFIQEIVTQVLWSRKRGELQLHRYSWL